MRVDGSCDRRSIRSMRLRLAVLALFLVAVPLASAGLPFKAKLTAPTHTPKVNTKWRYSVRVTTLKGKPVRARITVQIADPTGGVHPVQFGSTTKDVTNWPISGVFRDYVIWPADSREVMLKLRVTVKVGAAKKVVQYRVVPRA